MTSSSKPSAGILSKNKSTDIFLTNKMMTCEPRQLCECVCVCVRAPGVCACVCVRVLGVCVCLCVRVPGVCVCVCERERERSRQAGRQTGQTETQILQCRRKKILT